MVPLLLPTTQQMGTVMTLKKLSVAGLWAILAGCTYYENDPIKFPELDVPNPTTSLEASYVTTLPNKITSSCWKTADYLSITVQNQTTGQVPADDGLFNMSGTFNGLSGFNLGDDPDISIKAAYTNDSLYILITWKDTLYNASQGNWFYDGPADPKKPGSISGWTSQQSDDNLTLVFDMGSGKRDIWNWSLALSEPLGFAIDMFDNGSGAVVDAGNKTYVRNAISDNRSGPRHDWNGVQQELTRKPAGFTILDPGFYLLNKKNFTGDLINGNNIFQLECSGCHGVTGDGEGTINPAGIRLNKPGQFNRWTRQALDNFASDAGQHEGAVHYPGNDTDRDDLFARLRGFSGIPGYYLQDPSGSNSDIRATSNVQLAKIETSNKKYSVLIIRALNTGNADDIILDPSQVRYNFNFFLGDNDAINRIGAVNQELTFKPRNQ